MDNTLRQRMRQEVNALQVQLIDEVEATVADPLLSPTEVGKIFGVTPYTVRTWLKDGSIQGVKLETGHWRIAQSEVKRYANGKFGS